MAATIIILAVILVYCFLVIRKKVKDAKKGKFCDCGCQDCAVTCNDFSEKK